MLRATERVFPDQAGCTPWTVPERQPKPVRPAASQVAASWPGRPSQLSRSLVPAVKGVRTRRRSRPWCPAMSSSSDASAGTGRTGVTSPTTRGEPWGPRPSVARFVTVTWTRTSPQASRRSSVATPMAWTGSAPTERTTSAPASAATAWAIPVTWAEKAEPSWRWRSSAGRPAQPRWGSGRTGRSLVIQVLLSPVDVACAVARSVNAAPSNGPRSVPQWRTTGKRSVGRSRTSEVPARRRCTVMTTMSSSQDPL